VDLKFHHHGFAYAVEIIKMLPDKPDAFLLADFFNKSPVWA
jgi:hypothetical protein